MKFMTNAQFNSYRKLRQNSYLIFYMNELSANVHHIFLSLNAEEFPLRILHQMISFLLFLNIF